MALTIKALRAINNRRTRLKLAAALGNGEAAIMYAIKVNSDTLTKYAALEVIKAETGLSIEEIIANPTPVKL